MYVNSVNNIKLLKKKALAGLEVAGGFGSTDSYSRGTVSIAFCYNVVRFTDAVLILLQFAS